MIFADLRFDEKEQKFIADCLKLITERLRNQPNHTLAFGNTILSINEQNKPIIKISTNDWVELYSEDGYTSVHDIAHWADVVEDVLDCYAHGNKEYSVAWNKN